MAEELTGLEYADTHAAPDINAAGGLEGASQISRELASWYARSLPADVIINPNKQTVDARANDMVYNDGYASGAVTMHKDSIVGGQYTLNAQPNWRVLGLSEEWAEEFQTEVESKFTLWAESLNNYPDASRINTLTGLTRLAVAVFCYTGEVLATVEWLRQSNRPFKTAIQMLEVERLSNPYLNEDTTTLRGGIERNRYGEPIAYHIRSAHPNAPFYGSENYTWKRVVARKPWGRQQVIHIIEQNRPDQSRGLSDMVAVLKQMRMTQRYQDIVLQNAVLNATYAATIESELPPEAAYDQLGQGGTTDWAAQFLSQVAAYTGNSKNIKIDGVKIPHLYPGTKLKLQNAGTPGGVGERFEESLLRHIAASLGLSYEQFSRDYTKTNYSSARASMNESWKFMQARKKVVADRFATSIYTLWLEEAINAGQIVTVTRAMPNFYDGLNKEAYTRCNWIGASRGQIDEWKETQAAALRIEKGLSTFEIEAARLGVDFRELMAQQAREKNMREQLGLTTSPVDTSPAANPSEDDEDDGL